MKLKRFEYQEINNLLFFVDMDIMLFLEYIYLIWEDER